MHNSPVTDLLIRIKNGYTAGNQTVNAPYSKMREEILKKLVNLGFIREYKIEKDVHQSLVITLAYGEGEVPAFTDVKIFSKPGRRWYVQAKQLKPVLGGLGATILSTPKGIKTNSEARKEKVGGELLFEIW